MKNTWKNLFRRLAAGSILCGSTAWSSAMCYAVQLAFDSADDPVYINGWQEADNGGFGFGPWNFDGTYTTIDNPTPPPPTKNIPNPGDQQAIDDGLKAGTSTSSQFNNIGRAWTIFNPDAPNIGADNPPSVHTDISQAGRSFSPLQPGQKVTVLIDNPTQRRFFRGYTFRLNTGGGNTLYNGPSWARAAVGTFDYQTYGKWFATGPGVGPLLFDTDTAPGGMRIEFTMRTDSTEFDFDLVMTPLDDGNPNTPLAPPFTNSGDLNKLSGDYNENGTIDAADYVVWRDHLDEAFTLPNEEEGVTPNMVTRQDYGVWASRFGQTMGPINSIEFEFYNTDSDFYPTKIGAAEATDFYIRSIEISTVPAAAVGSGVPEPGTLVYFIAGGAAMLSLGLPRVRKSAES